VFPALAAAGCGARTQLPLGTRGGASNNSVADAGSACLQVEALPGRTLEQNSVRVRTIARMDVLFMLEDRAPSVTPPAIETEPPRNS
jgi:hypothetical protein